MKAGHALIFVFITALLDSIGFGIIMPVLPQLVMDVTGEGLSSAARYGGWLMFAYAGMQFFLAPIIGNVSVLVTISDIRSPRSRSKIVTRMDTSDSLGAALAISDESEAKLDVLMQDYANGERS